MRLTKTKNCPKCGYLIIKDFNGFGSFECELECPKCGEVVRLASVTNFEFISIELKQTTTLA